MAIKINLKNTINNTSIQIGDTAYYITPSTTTLPNGFIVQNEDIKLIGEITVMGNNYITIGTVVNQPADDDFIMFSKDKSVNNTSLLGYYAKIQLNNDSTEKAELFALSSEITISSK